MMDFTIENLTQIALFHDIPDRYHDFIFEEWRSHGITRLFFPGAIFHRALKEPEYGEAFIRKAEKHGIQLTDGHVPWTPEWALNTPEDFKDVMLENNRRALELLGQAGSLTVTIHVGDNICWDTKLGITKQQGRDLLDSTLEKLIPIAEKNKVVLCIENIISPADQPDELIRCFEKFPSDYFGCCFDSGHANVMKYVPGKDPQQLCSWIKDHLWRGNPQFYKGDALQELLPYIVTCHLHDNNGLEDQHLPPGQGTIDWAELASALKKAPRLKSIQSETSLIQQDKVYSISAMTDIFREVVFSH